MKGGGGGGGNSSSVHVGGSRLLTSIIAGVAKEQLSIYGCTDTGKQLCTCLCTCSLENGGSRVWFLAGAEAPTCPQ